MCQSSALEIAPASYRISPTSEMRPDTRCLAAATVLLTGLSAPSVEAQPGAIHGECRSYAADTSGTTYSPLDQITGDDFNTRGPDRTPADCRRRPARRRCSPLSSGPTGGVWHFQRSPASPGRDLV